MDGWMSEPDPPLTIDTSITLSHLGADMVESIRHMSHTVLAMVMFSRL